MTHTEDLYGITPEKLYSLIGKEQHRTNCEIRLKILRERLKELTEEDVVDPRISKIRKAINHWEHLKNEEEE